MVSYTCCWDTWTRWPPRDDKVSASCRKRKEREVGSQNLVPIRARIARKLTAWSVRGILEGVHRGLLPFKYLQPPRQPSGMALPTLWPARPQPGHLAGLASLFPSVPLPLLGRLLPMRTPDPAGSPSAIASI